jgi:hypothetical protein
MNWYVIFIQHGFYFMLLVSNLSLGLLFLFLLQTILLLCIGASFSFILGQKESDDESTKDLVVIEFAKQIYESMGKKHTSTITKDELVEWTKEYVFSQGATSINELYNKLAQIVNPNAEGKEE